MEKQQRQDILTLSWSIHDQVEQAILSHPASRNEDNWQEKQRLLMADMALHLLQTALKPGELEKDKLINNLNAILTLSDDYIDNVDLRKVSDSLYETNE
jgi:hypothetical protein